MATSTKSGQKPEGVVDSMTIKVRVDLYTVLVRDEEYGWHDMEAIDTIKTVFPKAIDCNSSEEEKVYQHRGFLKIWHVVATSPRKALAEIIDHIPLPMDTTGKAYSLEIIPFQATPDNSLKQELEFLMNSNYIYGDIRVLDQLQRKAVAEDDAVREANGTYS